MTEPYSADQPSPAMQPTPPPVPQPGPHYVVAQKSKFVAALLAFFFGTLGVHNFYLGYNGRAVAQLVMGVLGYVTMWIIIGFVLLVPLWIWLIVEIIMLLTAKQGTYSRSANGVPLS